MARVTENEKEKIKQLYTDGAGSTEIANKFKRSSTCILKLLKREGIKIRARKRKLSNEDRQNICRLYSDGMSAPQIAKKYNVSDAIILRYLKRNNIERRDASECHRIYPINEDFFDAIDTEEKAYFLGFLYADGGNIKSGNFVRIELQKQDKDILQKFAKLIYKENPEKHIKSCTRKRDIGSGLKEYYSCYLNINSKHVCSVLEKHGCMPAKTFKITFPEWLAPELQRHFIRGYFDGDGSVYVNTTKGRGSSMKITSNNLFIETVKAILEQQTKSHFVYYRYSRHIVDISTCGDKQVERILTWLYKGASIWLDRKHHSYQQIKNRKRAR